MRARARFARHVRKRCRGHVRLCATAFSQVRRRTRVHIAVAQRCVVWACEEGVDTREDVWDIDEGTPEDAAVRP